MIYKYTNQVSKCYAHPTTDFEFLYIGKLSSPVISSLETTLSWDKLRWFLGPPISRTSSYEPHSWDASRRFWRTTPDGLRPQNGPRGHGNHRDWKLFCHEDTRWYRVFLTKSQMGIELRLFASATLYVSNFTNKSNKSGAVTFTSLICTQHETRVMSVQRNLPKRLDNVWVIFWSTASAASVDVLTRNISIDMQKQNETHYTLAN